MEFKHGMQWLEVKWKEYDMRFHAAAIVKRKQQQPRCNYIAGHRTCSTSSNFMIKIALTAEISRIIDVLAQVLKNFLQFRIVRSSTRSLSILLSVDLIGKLWHFSMELIFIAENAILIGSIGT